MRLAQGTSATSSSFSALGWDWAERVRTAGIQEGNYVFALPSRATVSDFAVWDGPVRIPAVILERKRAIAANDAEIRAALETPDDGQDVSGKSVVSGWAFSTTNNPVTVTLRINGTNTDVVIPCCGPRADVQAGNSGLILGTPNDPRLFGFTVRARY